MGRRSLEATKLLWSWIVRAAVAFFRGACDFFAVDLAFEADEEEDAFEVFFLVVDGWLLCDEVADEPDDVGVCADNPLPCSRNSTARLDAVRRLRNIGGLSLT
jgi:hypothetical protein